MNSSPTPNGKDGQVSSDEMSNMVFTLAYFIHARRDVAIEITKQARLTLDKEVFKQEKRKYPRIHKEKDTAKQRRYCADLDELLLLQRHVLRLSESYEKESEENPSQLNEVDMLIRFVAYLIRITTKRNPFHTAIGLCRLLFHYSAGETLKIYSVVTQRSDMNKSDSYCSRRKDTLFDEIHKRFKPFLKETQGARKEKVFVPAQNQSGFQALIEEALRHLTPWQTTCHLPKKFDPESTQISALAYDHKHKPTLEEVEANRYHALIDPFCFGLLTVNLGLASPGETLCVPQFFNIGHFMNSSGFPGGRLEKAKLSDEELREINEYLDTEEVRSRKVAATVWIVIDGIRRKRLDLAQKGQVELLLDEGTELIQVIGFDEKGDVLLASHMLDYKDYGNQSAPAVFIADLNAGRTLTFTINPLWDDDGEIAGARLGLDYRPAPLSFWERISDWMPATPILKLAAGMALILFAAFIFWLLIRSTPTRHPGVEVALMRIEPTGGGTLSSGHEQSIASLREIASLWVQQIDGDDRLYQEIYDSLANRLDSTGRASLSKGVDGTNAALKIEAQVVNSGDKQQVSVRLRVVNLNGQHLWPTTPGKYQYKGERRSVVAAITDDLIEALNK